MAKAKNSSNPFHFVLMIAFGLLVLIVGFAVVKGGIFEMRSKAALGESIVKRWEFEKDMEGWTTTIFSNVKVQNSLLTADYGKPMSRPNPRCSDKSCQNALYSKKSGLWMITNCNDGSDADGDQQLCDGKGRVGWCGGNTFCCPGPKQKWTTDMTACGGNKYPSFMQQTVNTTLGVGKKYAKIRLAVNTRNPITKVPQGRERPGNFTITMTYQGKSVRLTPVQVSGILDGQFHEYMFIFPDIGSMMVSSLAFRLDGIPVGSTAQLDWVRLVSIVDISPPTYPTFTPTPQPPTPRPPTPTPQVSAFRNAYYLDGVSNYIKIGSSEGYQANMGFAFETMFKPTTIPFKGYIVTKSNSSTVNFQLYAQGELDPADSTKTRFYYEWRVADKGANCAARSLQKQFVVPNSEAYNWRSLAAVVESNGAMKLYIDGKNDPNTSNAISSACDSSLPIIIGAEQFAAGSVGSYLPGILDETRITGTQRYMGDYAPQIAPFENDIYTLVLYHQDEFFGDGYIKDYSGKGHDGVSYGGIKFVPHE